MIFVLIFVVIFPDIAVWRETLLLDVSALRINGIRTDFIADLFIHGFLFLWPFIIVWRNFQSVIIFVIILMFVLIMFVDVLVMRHLGTLIVQREFLEIPLVISERHVLVIFVESKIIFDRAIFISVLLESQFLFFFSLFLFPFDYFNFDLVRI